MGFLNLEIFTDQQMKRDGSRKSIGSVIYWKSKILKAKQDRNINLGLLQS